MRLPTILRKYSKKVGLSEVEITPPTVGVFQVAARESRIRSTVISLDDTGTAWSLVVRVDFMQTDVVSSDGSVQSLWRPVRRGTDHKVVVTYGRAPLLGSASQ